MDDPIKESTQEQTQDLSWYQNQVGKVLNFFTSPTPVVVEPAPTPVAVEPAPTPVVVEPAPTPVAVEPAPISVVVEPAPTPVAVEPKPPTLPAVQSGDLSSEFSRDEFLRLYRSKPNEFSAKYASQYPAQVAKQLAQSISFD